jgi:hypothetical protein
MRIAFVEAFNKLTGPDGTQRSTQTARTTYDAATRFGRWLAQRKRPPTTVSTIGGPTISEWRLAAPRDYKRTRRFLLLLQGLPPEARAVLARQNPRMKSTGVQGYTKAEFKQIMAAARRDLRSAAQRIAESRQLVERWHTGELAAGSDDALRAEVLAHVAATGDVPRRPDGRIPDHVSSVGQVASLVSAMHLTLSEVVGAGILLVGLTGHNATGISNLRIGHQRADGGAESGGTAVAVVDVIKARRGRRGRYMTVALTDVPDGLARDEHDPPVAPDGSLRRLDTAFGVYLLMHNITAETRAAAATDRLLVGAASVGGHGVGRHWIIGMPEHPLGEWTRAHALEVPEREPPVPKLPANSADRALGDGVLHVTFPRLRLTYVQQHQRGVAHTDATLTSQYLLRDRRNVEEYQRIVADTLDQQVTVARELGLLRALTNDDIAEFRCSPAAVASRFGTEITTLSSLLAGRLDTVLAGCIDEHDSPFTSSGAPCTASFILCLGCRNARATPQHLPVQAQTHHRLLELREQMPLDRWARRFGLAAAQLQGILAQFPDTTIERARAAIDDELRSLVNRLLDGELDRA